MSSKLVIGYTDGSVACVDVHSGKFINRTAGTESGASITTLEGQGGAAKCVFAGFSDGSMKAIDVDANVVAGGGKEGLTAMTGLAAEKWEVTSSSVDGFVRFWDMRRLLRSTSESLSMESMGENKDMLVVPRQSIRLRNFEEAEVGGVCPETVGHVDASSRLGIDSILSCAQYTREHVQGNYEFVSYNRGNTTCMWSNSCECVALGECPSGDPEGGWKSALIVRLLDTDLADKPVRYERKPHIAGGDPVSTEDSGIEYAALAPVIDGDVRMVGSPGLTAKSEGGQMLMSNDATNLIDVATDCSHGNVIEFLQNFKESCSMRAIVRFARMATVAFGITIILLSWLAFGCTSGYRRKLRRDAKASRERLEALRANIPTKVEAGKAASPQQSDDGVGGGDDGGGGSVEESSEGSSSEYDYSDEEDYSDYSSEEDSEEEGESEEEEGGSGEG
ncbi:hypothetical protein Pmar_PMAR015189 [Perkinsus marinus ATCC 50983]|uniref:Uncharacterized protein n=1 Tax=Perkinsus marinus (strain ATCC 50983 / TXsc) TaxID=423536 RepID=C5K5P1_PERM5|nr:hypothetical protein Pmar_PMAR015189 [Perkinsus marinus ATCC 50983]EER20198.1 hypothetical protein Pmar_PMAR015189 [Perkinsus marinus ATCC 50983]|eukprot:XP_002788402.1 hypothetical protein Pmar_PMAR015189 [Perkinsus marinus ATCC 50983]